MIVLNLLTTDIYRWFCFLTKAGEMAKRTVFLLMILLTHNASGASLMDLKSSGATCPFGYYHLKDKDGNLQCVSLSHQDDKCPKINDMQSYLLPMHIDMIRYQETGNLPCLGTYSEYTYDGTELAVVRSRGSFYMISKFAPTCPFGYYHRDGECVMHDTPESQKNCKDGFYKTVAESASFMALEQVDPVCMGTYSRYAYTEKTKDGIYPRYNGTLMYIGSKIGTFKTMKDTDCSKNPEQYYSIELVGVADDYQPFLHPVLGMCDKVGGYHKYIVDTDCKDIDVTNPEQLAKNRVCGVLCNDPGSVYTNSGVCSARGYCSNNGKHRRLHVGLPNGTSYSYPLYASKTSWPALNFKLPDDNGGTQTCYVNLVPPDAIEHFVGTKPNPLRLGYSLDYTGPDGKDYTAPTLITID